MKLNPDKKFIAIIILLLVSVQLSCLKDFEKRTTEKSEDPFSINNNYEKREFYIPMRDGVRLFTAVYIPKDKSEKYPFMFTRTPYTITPYGEKNFPPFLGPSPLFTYEKYIFVYQDVRGRFMSEGDFVNVRPFIPDKIDSTDIDESSDVYDTIEWLLKNIPNNNGKVGMWGISYPGFYTSMGILSEHTALVAASPQAPIADWFWDDFHHHGAFFLPHAFDFFSIFGLPRKELKQYWDPSFQYPTPDGYKFYLETGAVKNLNEKYLKNNISFWNDITSHPNYDDFWKARNIRQHLKNIKPAVMVVGGWYDAENLFGALETYKTIEKNNPNIYNILVMGPWFHGGWARSDGTTLGDIFFTANPPPSKFYQQNIELKFFNYYLKGKDTLDLPEAYIFETGKNVWHKFDKWPPENIEEKYLFFHNDGKLSFISPKNGNFYNEFLSDIDKPVPYTEAFVTKMRKEYMIEDQRFASRRPDVVVYQTDVLDDDITLAGNTIANLKVSTSGSDADWIVKLIDVYPDNHPQFPHNSPDVIMSGYQQMVRSEVLRGRFRNNYEKPEPFIPNKITEIKIPLQNIFHTFKKGHRIMIQVQSTWFPLVDRNPQKYVENIFYADDKDFQDAVHRIYCSKENSSFIKVNVIP